MTIHVPFLRRFLNGIDEIGESTLSEIVRYKRCSPPLSYFDSILIYKDVLRSRSSVQGDPFFGRRRRWSSEHHETDNAYCGPRAGVGGI